MDNRRQVEALRAANRGMARAVCQGAKTAKRYAALGAGMEVDAQGYGREPTAMVRGVLSCLFVCLFVPTTSYRTLLAIQPRLQRGSHQHIIVLGFPRVLGIYLHHVLVPVPNDLNIHARLALSPNKVLSPPFLRASAQGPVHCEHTTGKGLANTTRLHKHLLRLWREMNHLIAAGHNFCNDHLTSLVIGRLMHA